MVCAPTARVEVVKVAVLIPLPLECSIPVPMLVDPSKKVTVPVGLGPVPLTVAVKVTAWPNTDGLDVDATIVVLLSRPVLTTCVTVPLLPKKLLSPL